MIPLLAPLFSGAWAPYGETLICEEEPPADAIPIAALVSDDRLLLRLLTVYAQHLGVVGGDLRAVASAWSYTYLWALLPPVTAAASVLQHCFPMRAADVALGVSEAGNPAQFYIAQEGSRLPRASTQARYSALLDAHLAPLFCAIARQTGLPPKILWGNTARYLESIFEQLLALTGDAATIVADKNALLGVSRQADGRVNPLYGRQRRVISKDGVTSALHRQCCLFYRLPGRDYCEACPLAPEHQAIGSVSESL